MDCRVCFYCWLNAILTSVCQLKRIGWKRSGLSSNLANDLLRVDLQGYQSVRDVNLPASDTINDLRNFGFDFAAIIRLVGVIRKNGHGRN